MKKGISLITLIITIVVVIILAAVVILALGNNNPIDSARLSTVVNSKTNMEACISIVASKKIAETEGKEQMSDIVKSIIDESASEVKFTQDGTEKTIYRIAPDEFESRLGIVGKETPNKDCIWYVDNAGKVYLVFDFMKNVPNYLKESDTALNKSVKNFVIVLDSALESSIIENIEISKTEDTVGVGEDKNITLDLSKVEGLSYSKWVINDSKEKLGVDDETKYPNTVEGNSAEISLKSITNPGTYYLHVLVCTNDMKVEKISSAIVVEKKADVWDGSIAEGFASGDGTEANPYIIETAAQLAYFRNQVSVSGRTFKNEYIIINNNIDLDNISWKSIGRSNDSTVNFAGNLDGMNNKILNLKTENERGLFAAVIDGCNLSNIIIESGSIECGKLQGVGAVVGKIYGGNVSIKKCINKASINGSAISIGGIIGEIVSSYANVTISECKNYGNVMGDSSTGGILGASSSKIKIDTCQNFGNILSTEGSGVAGIVGNCGNLVEIRKCTNAGNITGWYESAGILGEGSSVATVSECSNTGYIKSTEGQAGGIIANSRSEISNCYNIGTIDTNNESYCGGISGYGSATITSCYNKGEIITENNYKNSIANYATKIRNSYCLVKYNDESESSIKEEKYFKMLPGNEGAVVDLLNSTNSDGNSVWKVDSLKNGGYPIFIWQ